MNVAEQSGNLAEASKMPRIGFGVQELADSIGTSRDTIDRAIKQGKIKAVNVLGRVIIPVREVDRLMCEGAGARSKRGRTRKMKLDAGSNGGAAAVSILKS
jgi:excisionase family DNA binding protein